MSSLKFRLSVLSAACLSVSSSPLAFADDLTPSTSDTKTLAPIVVTANREGETLNKTPAAISQINSEQIQNKHATFIGQLVNQTPGILMNDIGNEQHMMSIRQPITTAAVYQYLEDGRPVGVFNHNIRLVQNLVQSGMSHHKSTFIQTGHKALFHLKSVLFTAQI
jgi:outer membrane receptor for ferrienterochelin and colicin